MSNTKKSEEILNRYSELENYIKNNDIDEKCFIEYVCFMNDVKKILGFDNNYNIKKNIEQYMLQFYTLCNTIKNENKNKDDNINESK